MVLLGALSASVSCATATATATATALPGRAFPAGFSVGAGGGATIVEGFATLASTWNGRCTLAPGRSGGAGCWTALTVDRRGEEHGVVSVMAVSSAFTLVRRYTARPGRVLVNDTFACTAAGAGGGAACPLYTNHTFSLRAGVAAEVRLNGGFNAPQLVECDTDAVRGTNGNPSVVATRVTEGGGFGVVPLDDVFRAHGSMVNRATPTRIPGRPGCAHQEGWRTHPAFDLLDTYLAIEPGQVSRLCGCCRAGAGDFPCVVRGPWPVVRGAHVCACVPYFKQHVCM